jgi:hypothetical protein
MKFRKKPVVIEAIQLSWSNWMDVCDFVPKPWFKQGVYLDDATKEQLPDGRTSNTMGLLLNTLESDKQTGSLLATEGDWIIKGVAGEFYPCKDDIFRLTYEPVEGK